MKKNPFFFGEYELPFVRRKKGRKREKTIFIQVYTSIFMCLWKCVIRLFTYAPLERDT